MPFDASDWLTLLVLGVFCLVVVLQTALRLLRFLWWLAHPDDPLQPFVIPGDSVSSQPLLDLGPDWVLLYPCPVVASS